MAVGSAFYLGARSARARATRCMLVLALRSGWRIGVVRTLLESSVVVVGAVLGGTVGIGTIAFALLIGPALESSLWVLLAVAPRAPGSSITRGMNVRD
jgi:uncharacterized membrane protein YczE